MSKKKNQKLSHPSSDENNLTPWQKANRKYLAEQEMKTKSQKEDITLDTPFQILKKKKRFKRNSKKKASPRKIEFLKRSSKRKTVDHITVLLNRLPNLKSQRHKVLFRRLALIITVLGIPLIFDLLCFSL